MNMPWWFSNLLFWSAQVVLLVLATGLLLRILQIRQPRVLLVFWRVLLFICWALPFVQPWHRAQSVGAIAFAPDLAGARIIPESSSSAAHWHFPSVQIIAQIVGLTILAGIVARFVILVLGLLRLRQLRLASSPIPPLAAPAAVLDAMRARVNTPAEFRLSADVDSPVTFGFAPPVILLPERFPSMEPRFQEAIACHELLHVRRRDWAHHLAEEILLAAFWFHPAIAWLISRVRLAREQVVDLEVVRLTKARKPYLEALLEFTIGRARASAISAPPFLVERQLAERVALMLKEVRMSRTRLIASLIATSCCMALAIVLVVWTFPLKAAPLAAQSSPTDAAPLLERIQVNHHDFGDSLNDAVLRDEDTRIHHLPDRPTVETANDDARVDQMLKLLGGFWHDRGIEVVVRATLIPSPRSPRYAQLEFDVYKQTVLEGPLKGGVSGGVAGGVSEGINTGPGARSGVGRSVGSGAKGGVSSGISGGDSGDIPTVYNNTIWTDTVKRGPMLRQVRGLGTLVRDADSTRLVARVALAVVQAADVKPDQNATIDTRKGLVKGHVASINASSSDGTRTVYVSLDGPLPEGAGVDLQIDATIDIERLDNVLYVGRPVHAVANSTVSLFKIVNDGAEAERVNVKLGRSSVNAIEVLDGLKAGDKVILSDMSTYDHADRIHLK
jgi:beta-lactamase regulating signal transducer with metallopeptidase domain